MIDFGKWSQKAVCGERAGWGGRGGKGRKRRDEGRKKDGKV